VAWSLAHFLSGINSQSRIPIWSSCKSVMMIHQDTYSNDHSCLHRVSPSKTPVRPRSPRVMSNWAEQAPSEAVANEAATNGRPSQAEFLHRHDRLRTCCFADQWLPFRACPRVCSHIVGKSSCYCCCPVQDPMRVCCGKRRFQFFFFLLHALHGSDLSLPASRAVTVFLMLF
jgi:hypothetical protein